MTTHSIILAWWIPWTEEPGGLQSMGSQRVKYDWSNLAHMHEWIAVLKNLRFFELWAVWQWEVNWNVTFWSYVLKKYIHLKKTICYVSVCLFLDSVSICTTLFNCDFKVLQWNLFLPTLFFIRIILSILSMLHCFFYFIGSYIGHSLIYVWDILLDCYYPWLKSVDRLERIDKPLLLWVL